MKASKNLTIVVVGADGFVGRASVDQLRNRGAIVKKLHAPRLLVAGSSHVREALVSYDACVVDIAQELLGADAVINAAGNPNASDRNEASLVAANALLPAVLAKAVRLAAVPRFVHVSSAVVQGTIPELDQSVRTATFSAYSRSKALGELLVMELAAPAAVVYRPPSVHALSRKVSQMTARIARSPISSVASPGNSPSPQALLANVADAIAFLATTESQPPIIVSHPSEGMTTSSLLRLLGGREPIEIPRAMAKAMVAVFTAAGKAEPRLAANARRLEMLWFGQSQALSWLTETGWSPPAGHDMWRELGLQLASRSLTRDERA
ncbi:MAG: NAD(P)-dependent oxidoreductase [Cellulomonas sp.]|uniref:NAD-dependent epimerase/dehydratase family protein n=1 Tax=Cellulomonas sp. TaxID=40001 RepID=UPI0017D79959|nr:NAD(P)-dependent oxidoreductase [Cellulomonas sp.]NMM30636.1 NAD(P)-dependent oxidoreductase [Cellulomonas sp.]